MANSLKRAGFSGVSWTLTERIIQQVFKILLTVFLARLLSPTDYGLVGVLSIFTAISTLLINGGYSHALILSKENNQNLESSVFFYISLMAIVVYLGFSFGSQLISTFFADTIYTLLIPLYFLSYLLNGFAIVPYSILSRNLNFKFLTIINSVSYILSGFLALVFAFMGFGVWALVVQNISQSAVRTLLSFYFSKWRPTFFFSFSDITLIRKYSSKLTISGIINLISENIFTILIGKYYSMADLGYYTQGKRLFDIPTMTLNGLVQNVSFPILARTKLDIDLLNSYKKIIKVTTYVSTALTFYILVSSHEMIAVLLSPKWMGSEIYLQILALVGLTANARLINSNAFKIKNKLNTFLKITVIQQVIKIVLLFTLVQYGVIYVALVEAFSVTFSYIVIISYSERIIAYKMRDQLTEMGKNILFMIPSVFVYMAFQQINDIYVVFFFGSIGYFVTLFIVSNWIKDEASLMIKEFVLYYINKITKVKSFH